jgi:hypothetical protein
MCFLAEELIVFLVGTSCARVNALSSADVAEW